MEAVEIEKELKYFLCDIDELKDISCRLEAENNLFDILKISQAEIRHSNVLAWLCSPNESKEIGKYFLRKLFQFVMENSENFTAHDLLVDDFDDVEVRREWKHVDLLFIIRRQGKPDFITCIENKVKSCQGKNQLSTYRKLLESEKDFETVISKKRVCYLFLRVNNEIPNDSSWIELSYNEIGRILEGALKFCRLSKDVSFIINQYLSVLRRNGMMDDYELQNLAQKIYNKHKAALDYIYENVQNEDALKFRFVRDWFNKNSTITKKTEQGFFIFAVCNKAAL